MVSGDQCVTVALIAMKQVLSVVNLASHLTELMEPWVSLERGKRLL